MSELEKKSSGNVRLKERLLKVGRSLKSERTHVTAQVESGEPEIPEQDQIVTESSAGAEEPKQIADSFELPKSPEPNVPLQDGRIESEKTTQKKLFSGLFAKKPLPDQTPTAFFNKLPLNAQTTEIYDIVSPFSKVTIASLKELGGGKAYYIEEIEPTENEEGTITYSP